ncbi:MAG TPA: ABC transporter ATP-binding protein [Sediminispirochaeta sp.]|nr:ABC transporter ATP-binding protein [Sediminispirochaeta sp.]
MSELVLECIGVTKRFPGTVANKNVDFDLRRGEIHALLGENGAGKTTLMNCVYGLYSIDEGLIKKDGQEMSLKSPAEAIEKRIGMIHQHFMLIPSLSVVENVALCLKGQKAYKLDLGQVEKRIRRLSEQYGLNIEPWALVSSLSVGAQQRVEILKVLYREAEVLIMDEPTAVLTPSEVDNLFNVLRDITKQGNSVIFISHKLWEVMRISDRVTVLRDGERVDTVYTKDVSKEILAEKMVGREVFLNYEHPPVKEGRTILELKGVTLSNTQGIRALDGINLEVKSGEVLGIAGVDGNGQKELASVIHGMEIPDEGRIYFDGQDITEVSIKERLRLGLGHIPEDRLHTGVVPLFSIAENIVLIEFDQAPYTKRGLYRPKEVLKRTVDLKKRFDIRMTSEKNSLLSLSGGNQQKVVLAREISRNPKLLLAAQPTRGLDIGATEFTQKTLIEERSKGNGVLLISTDLDEVLAVSDRVMVIYEGKIMGELTPEEYDIGRIGLMMAGVKTV